MIKDNFKLAFNNLRKKKLRSFLTILGIFIAIATIFILIGLSLGLENAVKEQFRMLGSDKFFIMAKGQLGAPGTGGAVELTTKDVEYIEKITGIKTVSYMTLGNGKIEFDNKARYFYVVGMPMEKVDVFKSIYESGSIKIDEGKLLEKSDKDVVMIGSDYKYNNVFSRPVKAGNTLTINGREFKVKGILSSVGNPSDDKNVYMPMENFKELYNSGDRVDQIIVQIQENEDIKQVAEKVKIKLMKFRDKTEKTIDFEIMTPEEILKSFGVILNIITAFLLGVAAISLVVGGIGIMNTMYTSILERTKEIGTMKAIGAKNSDILEIFLIESGFLGLVGGIIGIAVGYGAGKLIEFIAVEYVGTNLLRVYFPWYIVIGVLVFSFFIGSLSGILPAIQASKMKPVDALRYE